MLDAKPALDLEDARVSAGEAGATLWAASPKLAASYGGGDVVVL